MKRPAAKILLIALALIAATAVALYTQADRVAIFLVSSHCDISIRYGSMTNEAFRRFDFTDLAISDRKTGIGLLAKSAVVRPVWSGILSGMVEIDFDLSDISFIKQGGKKADDYETFEGLAALPFSGNWTYRTLTGGLRTSGGNLHLEGLKATGDVIKFAVNGDFFADATIDSNITIYFSDTLFAKIPKQFTKGVLKDEGDGWQSFSLRLKGNYKEPAIEVTGKQFRLNISLSPA